MASCTFCGTEVAESPRTYVESPNLERGLTELARACGTCAAGFPVRFSVR